jgi:DNA-binding transcriptional MerR regulator
VLTAREAAEQLGVTVRQLNRYQQAGRIAPVQNTPRGRRQFTEESVEQLRRWRDEQSEPTP